VGNVADLAEIGRISGEKAAQILGGTVPQWLRTEGARARIYIIVNMKTAADLHCVVPDDVLGSANEIIR